MTTTADRIADAATRLLALTPAASMDDIAAAAGVSRATLFRHFPSRTALVAQLSRDALAAYLTAVDAARPEDGPAPLALRRVLDATVALAPRHGLLMLQPLPDLVEAELLEESGKLEHRLLDLVRRGQEAGDFRLDLSPRWVVLAVTWLVVAVADGLRLGQLAPGDVGHLVATTVLGALRPGPVDGAGQ